MPIPEGRSLAGATRAAKVQTPDFDLPDAKIVEEMQAERRIIAKPGFPFLYRTHPDCWEIETEGLAQATFLPQLMKHTLAPGVDGVRTPKRNEPRRAAYDGAIEMGQRSGFSYINEGAVIPAELLPEGCRPGSYCRALPCEDKKSGAIGTHYIEPWYIPLATPPGLPQRWKFDRAAFNRYRAHLVQTGEVPDILEHVAAQLQSQASEYVNRVLSAQHLSDDLHRREVDAEERRAQYAAGALPISALLDEDKEIVAPKTEPKAKGRKSAKPAEATP